MDPERPVLDEFPKGDIVGSLGSTGLKSCHLGLKSGPCCLLVYVDDLLLVCPKVEDADYMFKEISKHVELKTTSVIDEEGSIKFLGRTISRQVRRTFLLAFLWITWMTEAFGLGPSEGSISSTGYGCICGKDWWKSSCPRGCDDAVPHLFRKTELDVSADTRPSSVHSGDAASCSFTEYRSWATCTPEALRYLVGDMSVIVRLPAHGAALKTRGHFSGQDHLIYEAPRYLRF